MLVFRLSVLFVGWVLTNACGRSAQPESPAAVADAARTAVEWTGDRYVDMGRRGLDNLSRGDISAWLNDFAEDAVYRWNNGDSMVGRDAIVAYWNERRDQVLREIRFYDQSWLSLMIHDTTGTGFAQPGQWLLCWYRAEADYYSGGSMTQRVHVAMHLNEAGKIDRLEQFLDRVPIMAAQKP